mgnify:CR=1 FL=1
MSEFIASRNIPILPLKIYFMLSVYFFFLLLKKTDYLRFILPLFYIIKKHGCSLVIPELENLHILLFGTRFFKLHI